MPASFTIAAPDTTRTAPCGDCLHVDCVEARSIACSDCNVCGQPCGYDTPLVEVPIEGDGTATVHLACVAVPGERP